jgi:peptidyl-tRNA hydrolase, PTH1 family
MRLPLRRQRATQEKTTDPLLMVVGLRNPGPEYEGTRHNVGFAVAERLADRMGRPLGRAPSKVRAAVSKLGPPGPAAILVAPMLYMNESGRVVRAALDYWKVAPGDLLVVHDDIDLQFGRLRLQVGGGSGGHNGIRSVERSLSTREFSRLKVGIGRPPGQMDPADFVLRRFSKAEAAEAAVLVEEAADVVEAWFSDRPRAQELAAHSGRDR